MHELWMQCFGQSLLQFNMKFTNANFQNLSWHKCTLSRFCKLSCKHQCEVPCKLLCEFSCKVYNNNYITDINTLCKNVNLHTNLAKCEVIISVVHSDDSRRGCGLVLVVPIILMPKAAKVAMQTMVSNANYLETDT